jgi:hypothetical protein
MIAYDKKGVVFALTDGAELLVHDGPSEGPLWRTMLDSRIVGVGADSTRVAAITASGTISWFHAVTGAVQGTTRLEQSIQRAIVDATSQRVVVVTADAILAVVGDAPATTLASHGARAIGMAADGRLVAATDGELVSFAADGTRTAVAYAGPAVVAIAWHPEGFWILGSETKLHRWAGTGAPTHVTSLPGTSKLDHLAACGKAIAIGYDRRKVVSIAWPSKDTLGSVKYMDRTCEGVDFGPWPWLGISMDLGDGNKQNLERPQGLHRSDTHPGRTHHSWLVEVGGGSNADAPAKPAAAPAPRARPPMGMVVLVAAVIVVGIVMLMR